MLKPWQVLSERSIYRFGTTEMKEEICLHPEKGIKAPFFRMTFLDWVNVVPITPENQVVLVRQFRKGTHDFSIETPGGTMDPEEHDPYQAGMRELEEETGYRCDSLDYLGNVEANPAIQNNRCHFYLARDARPVGIKHFDEWEDLELLVVPWNEVMEWISVGKITHSLAILALMRAAVHLKKFEDLAVL
ncbi:MAG TPA: NUDIX hydrolase [Bacillota bacterium]|nr:NUDIX hydrolase [Bacillota bacterium]